MEKGRHSSAVFRIGKWKPRLVEHGAGILISERAKGASRATLRSGFSRSSRVILPIPDRTIPQCNNFALMKTGHRR
jgi:hypothetical protein